MLTSLRVMNAFVDVGTGDLDFDRERRFSLSLSFAFSFSRRSRSDLPAGIWSSLSSAMFHSRSSSVTADCA